MNKPEVFVEFCIVGDSFDPEEITELIGIAPTDSKKQHRVYNTQIQQYSYESYWSIKTTKSETWDVMDHLGPLITQLAPHSGKIVEISKRLSAKVNFLVCISLNGGNGPGMYFEPMALQFLSEIGASCDVDILQ